MGEEEEEEVDVLGDSFDQLQTSEDNTQGNYSFSSSNPWNWRPTKNKRREKRRVVDDEEEEEYTEEFVRGLREGKKMSQRTNPQYWKTLVENNREKVSDIVMYFNENEERLGVSGVQLLEAFGRLNPSELEQVKEMISFANATKRLEQSIDEMEERENMKAKLKKLERKEKYGITSNPVDDILGNFS